MPTILRIYLVGILLLAAGSARAESLRILTTEVPPLIFTKDGKLRGFCVDVVGTIQRRLNTSFPIESLPWARAYHRAQTEPNIVLMCPKRASEREKLFQWVGPILSSETNIYVKTGSALRIRTLDDAKALSNILVLRAGYSFQDLSSKGFKNLYEVNDAPNMVRMLMADRAPAMILESTLLGAVKKEAGVKHDEITSIYELQTPTSNLAFSRDVSQQTVKKWQAAFDAMKDDGSYTKLYEKWFGSSQMVRR